MTNHDHDIHAAATNADETPTAAQQPVADAPQQPDSTKAYDYDFARRPRAPMYTANPMPAQTGATARVHDKLSGKMMAFVIGISLACGLGAGAAGSAIANALNDSGRTRHTAPFAYSTDEQLEQLMPEDGRGDLSDMDMQDFGGGRRGDRWQRAEGDSPDRSGDAQQPDDSKDPEGSDASGDSGAEKESQYFLQYGDLLAL